MKYFGVTRVRGPKWNASLPVRKQHRWKDHAVFMDALAGEGVIALGGPLGGGEEKFLLIFNMDSEKIIEERLAADPWTQMEMLQMQKSTLGRFY